MGSILGVTGAKEPPFSLIQTGLYEIREYPQYVVAEVLMNNRGGNDAFPILARYIGVFGEPQNFKKQSIAMTAPVITEKAPSPTKISMTAPVIIEDMKMEFVLPNEYSIVGDAPIPTDSRINLREVSKQTVAVKRFPGSFTASLANTQFNELYEMLKSDKILNDNESPTDLKVKYAQYHPPFTIPFLRRNEVWIEIDKSRLKE